MPVCPPVRESYEEGELLYVGKDVPCQVGMRVRMAPGLISHGEGTVTAIFDEEEELGCCEVVWDSDQCHVRGLHAKLGNKHSCRVGKEDLYDLVLVDEQVCPDIQLVKHNFFENGKPREHIQVVQSCKRGGKNDSEPLLE
ncbi:hypothetical protein GUITHDRAFT_152980 [Guillardia theta CCMP2712]|uniref:Uncharacterized protein n=1 Tax=Guillardia theta (strain CCMP2712) TaxID=905079 RepID=L1J7J5_GUITC|nr:hypothetical protein GUITHDRAFT_152980 [Guillardia theta CCMP2712]EKX44501.1 hypothetical protein GUITHDRAFT_152980 [Guillardia theta CCMP2712]|eukprot:XP_005831481.1 hypothetical protein GUITHDRAFT_152980 [Guillardia theta CCMP2712]